MLGVKNRKAFSGRNGKKVSVSTDKMRDKPAGSQVKRYRKLKRVECAKTSGESMLPKESLGFPEMKDEEANDS